MTETTETKAAKYIDLDAQRKFELAVLVGAITIASEMLEQYVSMSREEVAVALTKGAKQQVEKRTAAELDQFIRMLDTEGIGVSPDDRGCDFACEGD